MKWQESPVSKTKLSQYASQIFSSWEIIWDVSNNNTVEFVARRQGNVAYVKYSPSALEKQPEGQREKDLAWSIDQYDDQADWRSFVESKNDNRLRKLAL